MGGWVNGWVGGTVPKLYGNGIPHHKYNVRGIAHVRTNRKDDIFMQRRLVQSVVRGHSDYCPHGAIF